MLDQNKLQQQIQHLKIITTTAGPNGDCWESSRCRDRDGYTQIAINQVQTKAHRYSFMIHYPDIDITGKFVCHHCDNPSCLNPEHLFSGTHEDNMKDARELPGS